ncbi:16S rRNA (uracil(1498)-N(3))-methyltransferase [Aureimonas fodinaquatilis]|uniref:Ribosomal RNA small subunit methyltransferase E n=1 Tax=Aureimonas fodinaquatilis TaxID=2565783 RepID=A0A5B0E1E6_9HYPH|nr:16S rRNA (uracil(1498)-N(3))-methyltransferase [Aureimonas fodinaquatilis]KAA0972663.1 16S rRNA (uracil(1498)-N(3))-methyltransferase [Aureimonas fodinaquatilis]
MPDHDFRSPRLFTPAKLFAAAVLEASPEQANYLANVMRLEEGASVLLFNGQDGEWRASFHRPAKKRVELRVDVQLRPQPPLPDLHYLFAPLKHARLDYMVQKAVEMGAGRLQPVMTQHCQAPRINIARMQANAQEAAEQCGILAVPDCVEMARLPQLLESWDASRQLIFCDERAADHSPQQLLAPFAGRPLAVLIGPEGGFSQTERTLLTGCGFVTAISLGPRILRADTAAVAALALVQAVAGDWPR